MLLLINTNRMQPPIAPLGLEYAATACAQAGIETRIQDLNLAEDPDRELEAAFAGDSLRLIGLSFRNTDDSYWPSARWFVPDLVELVKKIRALTEAPIVLGGCGFSIMPARILKATGADFGIHGDSEIALPKLYREVTGSRQFVQVPGLIRQGVYRIIGNPPAWHKPYTIKTRRDHLDNAAYFRRGGQGGVETKRGCNRPCIYCADPLAKGRLLRPRQPAEVADEIDALLSQGVDTLHFCDGEFNFPREHAMALCAEMVSRNFGRRLRWYAYLAVTPFDEALAKLMRAAGCAGINFTTDAAAPAMLQSYRQSHGKGDLEIAVKAAKAAGITVMLDLLLGGPGETPETVQETVAFVRALPVEAIGAGLGVRVYPGTVMETLAQATPEAIRRRYDGELDLLQPTFYIAPQLGEKPAALVREIVGADERFFTPQDDAGERTDHNYSDNRPLIDAIERGARGAYWDILRKKP